MNRKEVCQSLIKIANKLDESGYYKEANQITSVANNINKLAASFLGDLGGNLLGEISSELNKKNPTIFDPTTGQYKTDPNNFVAKPDNVLVKQEKLDQQAKLFEAMKQEFGKPLGFNVNYPELANLTNMEQVYRKAWDLSKFSRDFQTKTKYDRFVRAMYTKYYQQDVILRYQLRQLGA